MKYKVTLNDRVFEVEVELGKAMLLDEYELIAPAASVPPVSIVPSVPVVSAAPTAPAAPAAGLAAGEAVKSPMPGNVLKILVSQGQQVKEGDVLLILEAMKMENEIPAPKDGTITDIHVHKGDTLQEGDPVVTIA